LPLMALPLKWRRFLKCRSAGPRVPRYGTRGASVYNDTTQVRLRERGASGGPQGVGIPGGGPGLCPNLCPTSM
jgi:hypothetical protein